MEYTVNIVWDKEANVWIASSNEIPGLVLESDSYDTLTDRLRIAVPDILEANHLPKITKLNYSSNSSNVRVGDMSKKLTENFCTENPFTPLTTEEILAELAESRACYECGEYEDFDDALDDISKIYGI